MEPLITKDEYQNITGANYGNALTAVKFNADLINAQTLRIKNALPTPMWVKLQAAADGGDPLGPELEAFTNDYIKPLIAYALYARVSKIASASVTAAGVRVINEPTSQQANGDLLAGVVSEAEADFHRYKTEMYNEYKRVNYVFDGIAYPPEPKMKQVWSNLWAGRNFAFANGQWGWWLGGNFMDATYGSGSNSTNSTGVNIGSIKPNTYWGAN